MEKYRTIPIEVRVVKFNGTNLDEVDDLFYNKCEPILTKGGIILMASVETLNGNMLIRLGDYVVETEWETRTYYPEKFNRLYKKID